MKPTKLITISSTLLLGSSMFSQAAVSIVGSADFTLSSTTRPGTSHDNLPSSWPTAFYELVDPGSITPSGDGTNLANLTDDSWATGHLSGTNSWFSPIAASATITLSFPSANLAGLAFNWGWNDRDEGDYEVLINGTTSLGTFNVASGSVSPFESNEPNTYVVFDSPQIGVTSVQINMSGGNGKWGLDELEVWAIPEPSSTALLGLGGLALMLRRKRS